MPEQRGQTQVGQYYLMEKIAQGGMAEIFKGLSYDVHGIKKTVCIKKILPHLAADPEFITSLIDEAKLAVKLVHGNIAQTFDLGKVGDDYFMVMEFVDGRSLSQIAKRARAKGQRIPLDALLYFVAEILSGLDYMHRRADEHGEPLHIVHRDISPQNIMVSYSGTVKIIDFGIAKAVVKVGSTDSGILKGKFAYMSPEQAHGESIDHRSDLFSLGIILHEMLTGRRLFKAEDSRQTIRNVRRAKVDPPSAYRGDLPEELDRIALRALAKDRRKRYPFASEMRDDCIKLLHAAFPDFRPADAAAFVQELFADDLRHPEPLEADAKTPHLIIDGSNSALADDSQFEATGIARSPLDMREYMLEETTDGRGGKPPEPPPPTEADTEAADAEEEPEAEALPPLEPSETTARRRSLWRRLPMGARISFGIALLSIAALLALLGWRFLGQPQPTAGARLAELMITTDPPDARVELDGRVVGERSPVTVRNLSADTDLRLRVEREGYRPHERTLALAPGSFRSIRVTLEREAPKAASIEFISDPAGAIVYLDDKETALRTPATLDDLAAGQEHTIGLYREGYRFWNRTVELAGGERRTFDVQLVHDFGGVSITSSPADALVMIDDVPVGQTPYAGERLEPGTVYRIKVWHEGYAPQTREIKAQAGHTQELHIVLERTPAPPASATQE